MKTLSYFNVYHTEKNQIKIYIGGFLGLIVAEATIFVEVASIGDDKVLCMLYNSQNWTISNRPRDKNKLGEDIKILSNSIAEHFLYLSNNDLKKMDRDILIDERIELYRVSLQEFDKEIYGF